MKDWQRDAEDLGADHEAAPDWTPNGAPMCAEDECGLYDGKRCMAMGARPDRLCLPVVERMSELLTARTKR